MPRITAERREERRQQIIQATLRCAIRLGLHHVTMAEVISESGLSAGAVYGYFATKDELLTAVADSKLGMLNGVFTEMLADGAAPSPGEVLERLGSQLAEAGTGPEGDATVVIVQAWGQAVQGGEFAELLRSRLEGIIELWAEVLRRQQRIGLLPPRTDVDGAARLLQATSAGMLLFRLVLGEPAPGSVQDAMQLLQGVPAPTTSTSASGNQA